MTENITYQSSRTVKRTRVPAGVVRKMSLAVLVDQDVTWQKEGAGFKRVLVPPPPEKLKVIRDLVAGITGVSQERGDQLVIETLPFENTLLLEPPAAGKPGAPPAARTDTKMDPKMLIYADAALAAGVIALVLLRLLRRKRRKPVSAEVSGPAALPAGDQPPVPGVPVTPAAVEKQIETQLAEREALQQRLDTQALAALKLSPVITKKAEVFARHIREKIAKEPDISVQILKSWIREDGE
jgi:flagellar M-ring protein FliF